MKGGIPRAAVRRWRTARELPCGDLIDSCPTDTDKRCKILSARALEGFFVCRNGRTCPVGFPGTCRGCDAMGYEILLRLSGHGALGCEIRRRLSGRDALGYGSCPALVGGAVRWAMRFSCACRGHGALGYGSCPALVGVWHACTMRSSDVRQGVVGVTLRVFRWKCGGIGAADS